MLASYRGRTQIVEMLKDKGARLVIKDRVSELIIVVLHACKLTNLVRFAFHYVSSCLHMLWMNAEWTDCY
jgi:hypothetical protein